MSNWQDRFYALVAEKMRTDGYDAVVVTCVEQFADNEVRGCPTCWSGPDWELFVWYKNSENNDVSATFNTKIDEFFS